MKRSVAILDDEPAFRNFVGAVAQACGFASYDTDSPTVFEEYVSVARPTAAVLELAMVERDGVEVLDRLSRRKVGTPFIIASRIDDRILQTARRFGEARGLRMVGAVRKPVPADDLRVALALAEKQADALSASDFVGAIARDELLLHYQPCLDLRTRRVVGVEALVRWQHPHRGLVPPAAFVPLAEESQLIDSMTEAIFAKAVAQVARWRAAGTDLSCAVNFSASTITSEALLDAMLAQCRHHRVAPARLTIELTETAAARNGDLLRSALARLREYGFRIAIDDFGTGFSSLARLRDLPFAEVKLDRSFIAAMPTSRECRIIVKSTIDMAHELGLEVVAEGIESTALLLRLATKGCDRGQGYGISPPLEEARVPAFAAAYEFPIFPVKARQLA